MNSETFIDRVQHRLGSTDREEVVKVAHMVLSAFGEQLSHGQAEDLAAQLDHELANYLLENAAGHPDDLAVDGFFEKVAARQPLEVGEDQARRQAAAVLGTLGDAVDEGERRNAASQLSTGYQQLLSPAGGA